MSLSKNKLLQASLPLSL